MLFTGDALIPSEWYSTMIGVFQDATKYIQSLEKISKMDVNTLCPGHEPIRERSEVQREIKTHIERYLDIERNLIQILSESGGMTLWEIYRQLADKLLAPGNHAPGIGGLMTLRGFLNKLSFEGKIAQDNGSTWRGVMR